MNNVYYKILNEIASVFNMDQWDEQVNLFTDAIDKQLNAFIHNTENDGIFILENYKRHKFPQFDFYKKRCYVNGEKVKLDIWGTTENKWRDQGETVKVIIKDLDKLGESCAYMFYSCYSLVSVPWFNTKNVLDMEFMFFKCRSLVSVPKFDISNVNNMTYMFIRCICLESVPLFDGMNKVLNQQLLDSMNYMFNDCPSLSKKTKQAWSSIGYNFRTHKMK